MSSLSAPVVPKEQQSAFEPFVIDFPATAPASRLPFHVAQMLRAFQIDSREKPVEWRVGHVHPIGWFILHENGSPVFVENTLAMSAFWRLYEQGKLVKTHEIEELNKRVKQIREGVSEEHQKRESDKHLADQLREFFGRVKSTIFHNPVPNEYGVVAPDESGNVFNQGKPAGLTAGATPDPANPNIEAEKAASTSSISSDSAGAPGNKTMQPHGSPDAVTPVRSEAVPLGSSGDMTSRQTAPNAQGETEAAPNALAMGSDTAPQDANPGLRAQARSGDGATQTVKDTSAPAPASQADGSQPSPDTSKNP